ncbi:MAG: GTPase [Promethearchaeota archaeon]
MDQERLFGPFLVIIGRSNTGKSSLCRLLFPAKRYELRVGKSPGVTRRPVIIRGHDFTLADLPGFGYMKHSSKKLENQVKDEIISFLEDNRGEIFLALHVINIVSFRRINEKYKDVSVPFDKELESFLDELMIPSALIVNKMDKLKAREKKDELKYLKDEFTFLSGPGADFRLKAIIPFSTKTRSGLDRVRDLIDDCLEEYKTKRSKVGSKDE